MSVWVPLDSTINDIIWMALGDSSVRGQPASMRNPELTIDNVLCSQRLVASRVIRYFRQTIPNLDIPKDYTLRELFTEVMSTSISSNLVQTE